MTDLLLPVSLGEGIDKLSILDIKCEKIKDNRKDNCLKEYNELYKILKPHVEELSYFYKILKEVNLTIWNLQENIHNDSNLTDTYGKILVENDRRFRVKKKINNIINSTLKEEKGYNLKKCFCFFHQGLGDHMWCNGAVRYLATCYDEVTIVVKRNNEAVVRSMYLDDPTITFFVIDDDSQLYPFVIRKQFLESQEYKVFSCGYHVTDKEPSIYEFPHSFYDDLNIDRTIRTTYFHVMPYKESHELYKSMNQPYILIHQKSSQKSVDIYSKVQHMYPNMLVLDINENHYAKGHMFYDLAQSVVNQPMIVYKDLIEHAKEIHCLESSFYCFASHLDLSKVEKKVCYEPYDNSAQRIGVFSTGSLTR